MLRFAAASVCLLAGISLALTACATPATTSAIDWDRPFVEPATAPVLLRDMAIANPPYPHLYYVDYTDEPTRFEFRPRNVVMEEIDNGTGEEEPAADNGSSYIENGILYVDPNE